MNLARIQEAARLGFDGFTIKIAFFVPSLGVLQLAVSISSAPGTAME
jgi:hypothetical protein